MIDQTANLPTLKEELAVIEAKISKISGRARSDNMVEHFHLGMGGGSGRHGTGKRRMQQIDKSIDRAVAVVPLRERRDALEKLIADIESGKHAEEVAAWAALKQRRIERDVAYWNSLKAGGQLILPGNNRNTVTIARVSKKSVTDVHGTRWSINRIIGKEAAAVAARTP